MIGTTLGEYTIEAQVSSGGMGTIYRASHIVTGQIVALKVLQQALSSDRAFLQRFRREAIALKKVDHPNVVRIHAVGTQGSIHYYAMEYLPESLADRLRQGPMELKEAIRIVAQVARGLAAVHAAGIRHRDVKPSNILFDTEGNAKIADFGIAKLTDATRVTQTGVIVGTPAYMAPEQVDNTNVDARADIYSLGVVLYEAIVGRPPFTGSTTLEILRKHRYTLPESPKSFRPEVPMALAHLVLRMLAKDPKKRPDTMTLVADALEHIGRNLGADASAVGEPEARREPTASELLDRYERAAARVARWGKRVVILAVAALLAYFGYSIVAYYRLTPADYWREARALEAESKTEAAGAYEALIRRFPSSPEATAARQRLAALEAEGSWRQPKASFGGRAAEQAAALRAQTAYLHYQRAERVAEAGDIEHARQIYRMVRTAFADTRWGIRADQRLQELDARYPTPPTPAPDKGVSEPKKEPGTEPSEGQPTPPKPTTARVPH